MDGNLRLLLTFLLVTLILAACANQAPDEAAFLAPPEEPLFLESAAEDEAFAPQEGAANILGDVGQTSFQVGQAQERLIIREGQMSIVVENTDESLKVIAILAAAKNGWVVDSEVFQSGNAKSGSITIRIPAEEFDTAVEEVRDLALEVTSESTNSQDVTEEFVDLEARVANLEATADRVRSFLDEAKTVEEALAVNAELSRLESEIESLKARMKFLSESAAFSRLTVFITPDELSRPIEVGGWRPEGVALSAVEALISALQSIASVLIWGVIFCLPLAIIFGIPAFFLIRYVYRRRRKSQDEAIGALEPDDGESEEIEPSQGEEKTQEPE
ncbi:MAG: hypothetical protein AMJ56_07055 [Anaerolineae bacterium SG8_19]|nr:MAG: hypothetical protein AMJ56_07055 [Anaerolineae bacterium SG8_19]